MEINLITEDTISNVPIPVKISWKNCVQLSEKISAIKDFLIVGEAYGKALRWKALILV